MFGICVWQRGHEVVFPELYPVPGGHTVTANNSNSIIHKNYRPAADSHANTIVLGSNCVILHHTGKVCKVSPYLDDYEAIKTVPVVCGMVLWTDTEDNQEYILVFNESL